MALARDQDMLEKVNRYIMNLFNVAHSCQEDLPLVRPHQARCEVLYIHVQSCQHDCVNPGSPIQALEFLFAIC